MTVVYHKEDTLLLDATEGMTPKTISKGSVDWIQPVGHRLSTPVFGNWKS